MAVISRKDAEFVLDVDCMDKVQIRPLTNKLQSDLIFKIVDVVLVSTFNALQHHVDYQA